MYVASQGTHQVLRYSATTGAFIDVFATQPPIEAGTGTMWLEFGTDGYLYTTARDMPGSLNASIVRFNAMTGAYVDRLALGRDGWSFQLAADGLLYESGDAAGGFVDRFGPTSLAAFTVSLDSPAASPVTVNYTTADGTAHAGSDYVATSGTLTFALGQTTRTVLVPTLDDHISEPTETFFVNLSSPVGATIARGQGVGSIIDNNDPLQVASAKVNGGAVQRSRVTDITVAFTGLATLPANPVDAFRLTRLNPDGSASDVTLAVDLSGSTATQTVARLTFSGGLTEFGSLADGRYRLTILASQVSGNGQPLDGDANGTPGGDFVLNLFRLYGDINGDGAVNGLDLALFRGAFGTSLGSPNYVDYLDLNGDGAVNGLDLAAFRARFGTTLP
jgi:hypothetical protein